MAQKKRMTEDAWSACAEPLEMLAFLRARRRPSDRKLRLYACACERQLETIAEPPRWSDLPAALAAVEAITDGAVVWCGMANWRGFLFSHRDPYQAAVQSAGNVHLWAQRPLLADLLRCVVGNPFRPVVFDPVWRTPEVLELAAAGYEERSLPDGLLGVTRLPVLGDALEEAGCSLPDLLAHLRGPGPHVRGCWALDCALNKE
jgi:hypothetical protein